MGVLIQRIGKSLQNIDLFSAPTLLMYQNKPKYTTRTSLILSILFLSFMFYFLYTAILNIVRRQNITVALQVKIEVDPSPLLLTSQNFFIALGNVQGILNLNNSLMFDFQFVHQQYTNGNLANKRSVGIVQCNQNLFSRSYNNFSRLYEKMQLNQYICFPQSSSIAIYGKQANRNYSKLVFRIKKCSYCQLVQSKVDFEEGKTQFYIDYYFINNLINPNSPQPISLYFEDKFFSYFGGNTLKRTNIYISQYEVISDESFMAPFQNYSNSNGIYIQRQHREQLVLPVIDNTYVELNILKSDEKIQMNRSFEQTDDLLSYVGGIFSILGVIIGYLIKKYNKYCFELEMAKLIFRPDERDWIKGVESKKQSQDENSKKQEQNKSQTSSSGLNGVKKENRKIKQKPSLNFFTFILFLIFRIFPRFECFHLYKFEEQLVEAQHKINIDLLLEKLIFYEKYLKCFFKPNQITLLMLQAKKSPNQFKVKRKDQINRDEDFYLNVNLMFKHALNEDHQSEIKESKRTTTRQTSLRVPQNQQKVFIAIRDLLNQSSQGDSTSKNILDGVCREILNEFEQSETKKKKKKSEERRSITTNKKNAIVRADSKKSILSMMNSRKSFSFKDGDGKN